MSDPTSNAPETATTVPAAERGTETDVAQPGGFALDVDRRSVGGGVRAYLGRIRSGDPGALPSILGLIALGLIFSQVSDRFLTLNNVGNLPGQGAYIAVIALGLVFVLLLGEIDLSAGTAGGICAGFAAQAVTSHGLHHGIPGLLYWALIGAMIAMMLLGIWLKTYIGSAVVAIGLIIVLSGLDKHVVLGLIFGVGIGAAVGIFTGWLVAKIRIPSFVVTLALFLAWQGVLLFALNQNPIGTNQYPFWYGLAHENMSPTWSWVYALVVSVGYLAYTLIKSLRAQAKGLAADTVGLVLVRGGVAVAIAVVITAFANKNRNPNPNFHIQGLPWALTVPVTLMIVATIALTKTTWGRHLFATGGNAEAARRAGIDVTHIRVSAFVACSSFAAVGGIFLSSLTGGAQLDLGAGNILLFAVAAAVIGGTSLFGGRGKPRDAIIGALVIVIIPNGLGLRPSLPAAYQNVVTGLVLLIAAAVDALSRRRSRS